MCDHRRTTVVDTDKRRGKVERVRRRRVCLDCGEKYTTYEISKTDYDILTAILK